MLMKKVSAILLVIAMMFTLGSCSRSKSAETKTYSLPIGSEPNEELTKLCSEIYQNVANYYKQEKEMPKIVIISENEMDRVEKEVFGVESGENDLEAFYWIEADIIYLKATFKEENAHELAHEFIHYLSDNGNEQIGFEYTIEPIRVGIPFNEGTTEYLTEKVYPKEKKYEYSSYAFEQMVVKQFILAFGEEKFTQAYFNSSIEELRKDFNNATKNAYENLVLDDLGEIDQFDSFMVSLYVCYYYNMYETNMPIENVEEKFSYLLNILWYYGDTKGVEEKMQEIFFEWYENG